MDKQVEELITVVNQVLIKYDEVLTISEYNMLMCLAKNCLLLEVREFIDNMGVKRLVAYDIDRNCVFNKKI